MTELATLWMWILILLVLLAIVLFMIGRLVDSARLRLLVDLVRALGKLMPWSARR